MTTILYPVFGRTDRRPRSHPQVPCDIIIFPAPLKKAVPAIPSIEPGGEGSASGGGGRRRRARRS